MAPNEGNPNGEQLTISELLCYATFNMKRSTTEQLVKVIYRFYDIEEIIVAKKLLYQKYPQLGEYPTRKTSVNRSEQEAHVIDIIDSMVDLDSQGVNLIFVAQNLKRIPKCDPHETDHISILEKIRKLECRLNSAENELSESKVQILTISDNVMDINSRVESCEKNMVDRATADLDKDVSYADVMKRKSSGQSRPLQKTIQTRPPAREPIEPHGPPTTRRLKDTSGARGDGGADGIWGPTEVPDVPADDEAQKVDKDKDNVDGFMFQRNQLRKDRRHQRNIVTGTSGNVRLRGGPPPVRDFFVYRVMKPADEDDVAECLRENNIQFESVLRVSKEEAKFCSFKLTVPLTDSKRVMEPDVWPEGVRIRKFTTRPNHGEPE